MGFRQERLTRGWRCDGGLGRNDPVPLTCQHRARQP